MKKSILLLVVALAAVSCNLVEEKPIDNGGDKITLTASIDASSRLEINTVDDNTFNHFWQDGDQIRVFDGAGNSAAFDLDGYNALSPSNIANFAGSFGYTPTGAVYPAANASASFDGSKFTVTFPTSQSYVADTYDPSANVYVATCSGTTLTFQPISCYLRVALYSTTASTAVDHIVVSSVGGEKIAGLASVTTEGEVTMDDAAVASITLSCASPVTLSSDSANPTYFYIAVPAVAVTNGLKVDVYKSDGSHLWRNVSVSPLDKKNKVLKMGTLEYSPKATDSKVTLATYSTFNPAIKTLAKGSTVSDHKATDNSIKHIIFETNKNMTGISGTDISNAGDGSIIATWDSTTKTIRIQTSSSQYALKSGTSGQSFFRALSVLQDITGLDLIDVTNCTSFVYMFSDDVKLKSADLSSWHNTSLSGKGLYYMFYRCKEMTALNISNLNTENATDMSNMFHGCMKITNLDLSNFNTSGVTEAASMEYMFYKMPALNTLTLGEGFINKKLGPEQFFFGSSLSESDQTAGKSSDGFLHIRCTEATGQWLIKTNLRLAHPTNSTYTKKIDTKFHIWNESTSAYEYKTVHSKLGGISDYAGSTTYINWPSTASAPTDLDWTGDPPAAEAEALASTTTPVATYGTARTGGISF